MIKIIEDLNWRYATKNFDTTKKVSAQNIDTIHEALRLTPSSFGLQPWKFIFVENPKLRIQLKDASFGQTQITQASHLLVLCTVNNIDQELINTYFNDMISKTNVREDDVAKYRGIISGFIDAMDNNAAKIWADKQVYIALGNIMTVLAEMKIDACPIEGFDKSKYDTILGLTERGISSTLVLPIGYRSQDDRYAHEPKIRFDKNIIIETI